MANHMFDRFISEYYIRQGTMSEVGVTKWPLIIREFDAYDVLYIPVEYKVLRYIEMENIGPGSYPISVSIKHGYVLIFENPHNNDMQVFHTDYIDHDANGVISEVFDIGTFLSAETPVVWATSPDLILARPLFEKKPD